MVKKIIIICVLLLGIHQVTNAQLHFGLKGGVNYNSDSFEEVTNDVLNGAKSKTGYHAGVWFRAKIPALGLYIRPELVYTELKNDVTYNNFLQSVPTDYKFRKIDIPVLFGKQFLKIGNIFVGPSFQYIMSSDFGIDDLQEISIDQFTMGIQLGVGLELGRLGIDARYEKGLSKIETSFTDKIINSNINFDTRISQIIVGVSYRLNQDKKKSF